MKENLPACLDIIFGSEGGYTDDRRDKGNWTGGKVGVGELKGTKYGIAASAYPFLDIKNITKAQAVKIYERDYWAKINGDMLGSGVDLATFDAAVNSGQGTARSWLMSVLGGEDYRTVQKLCAKRLAFVRGLSTWTTYSKGWTARIAKIEATGVSWALHAKGFTEEQVKKTMRELGEEISKVAQNQGTAGKTAGGATAGGGVLTSLSGVDIAVIICFVLLMGAMIAWIFYRSYVNKIRAELYHRLGVE
jgi:lysozyme family protein